MKAIEKGFPNKGFTGNKALDIGPKVSKIQGFIRRYIAKVWGFKILNLIAISYANLSFKPYSQKVNYPDLLVHNCAYSTFKHETESYCKLTHEWAWNDFDFDKWLMWLKLVNSSRILTDFALDIALSEV